MGEFEVCFGIRVKGTWYLEKNEEIKKDCFMGEGIQELYSLKI